MRLNLGCCDALMAGYVNVDAQPPADVVADLNLVWPWEDSTVEYIVAADIIEHLPNKVHTMNEMWRVLISGGRAEIIVPTTDGRGAWQDPTHVSYWNRNSFTYHDVNHGHHQRFRKVYRCPCGCSDCLRPFRIVTESVQHLPEEVVKLAIVLEAVKG